MPIETEAKRIAAAGQEIPDIEVWDTQYFPSSKAFGIFREGICSTFMPWSPEYKSGKDFSARIEGISFKNGSVGRVRMPPLVTTRTKTNIANSNVEGFYANFILSGELNIDQSGRCNTARPGDLVVYDTTLPVTSTGCADGPYEDLSFLISKSSFSKLKNAEAMLGNTVLQKGRIVPPLASCLTMISETMLSSTREELTALFDACVALLPLSAGVATGIRGDATDDVRHNDLRREILHFVGQQLSNDRLSPQHVATHFGISPRYVHKIFAGVHTTFSCYVTAKRLDHVRVDLSSAACRHQPIFALAYRWGFNDVSTFIRVFKKRYGYAPSHFRARAGS